MRRKRWLYCFLCLLLLVCLPTPAFAQTKKAINLSELNFPKGSNPQFFVAYIYINDNVGNPENNTNRDITLYFNGKEDYCLTKKNKDYVLDFTYTNWGVIRATGYLPTDIPLTLTPKTSDSTTAFISYRMWREEVPFLESDPLLVLPDYNEYFIVGGSEDWLIENASIQYDTMYQLFHSETGSVNENAAYTYAKNDAVFRYWQEQMKNDWSIQAFQTEDGATYTREQLTKLGYPVPLSEDKMENPSGGEGEETDKNVPNPPAKQEEMGFRVPPIAVVLIVGILAVAFIVIAYIRKEKNDSDLYID